MVTNFVLHFCPQNFVLIFFWYKILGTNSVCLIAWFNSSTCAIDATLSIIYIDQFVNPVARLIEMRTTGPGWKRQPAAREA